MLSNLGKFSIALNISAVVGPVTQPLQAALLVSSSNDNSIKQYDETIGAYIQDFVTSGSGGLLSPSYITTANVPVPEPSSVLGVVALGSLFVGGALQRKASHKKLSV